MIVVFVGAFVVLPLVVIYVDAARTRRTMISEAYFTIATLKEVEGTPRTLIVYLPGILARAKNQMVFVARFLVDGLPDRSIDLLMVDYGGDAFRPRTIATQVAIQVQWYSKNYDQIAFVGASLGGRMLNAVFHELSIDIEVMHKVSRPIIIDAPMDRRDFAAGGSPAALVLRFIPIGTLVNRLKLTDKMAQPPKDKNIGNDGDFAFFAADPSVTSYSRYIAWVKKTSMEGLTGHDFSVWRDQLVAMATMPWYNDAFAGLPPLYIACTAEPTSWRVFDQETRQDRSDRDGNFPVQDPGNDTVKQFRATASWQRRVPTLRAGGNVWVVRSTHCGFMERPVAWRNALSSAVSEVTRDHVSLNE
jgi:hypothetical protein